jgi:hypothetical protein
MSRTDILNISKTIFVYTYPVISIIGLITNSLAFVIFSRKKFHNTIFFIYFRFILLFDIFSMMIPINKFFESNFNIYFRDFNQSLCKFRYYYIYVVYPISGWGLVVVSIDRFVSIAHPNRFLIRKKILFQIVICCSIFTFNLIYYIPMLFYFLKETKNFNNQTNKTTISYKCTNQNYPTDWFNIMNTTLMPFIFMFLFTILTLRFLFNARNKSFQTTKSYNKSIRQKDVKFAVTSVTLNIIFLILNLPYGIYSLLAFYIQDSIDKDAQNLLYAIIYVPFYINLTTVFFINIKVNSMFRNEFKILILSKKITFKIESGQNENSK